MNAIWHDSGPIFGDSDLLIYLGIRSLNIQLRRQQQPQSLHIMQVGLQIKPPKT